MKLIYKNMFENRNYLIFNMSEVDTIDFSEVLESSVDTLRLSIDEEKSFIKWDGNTPSFVSDLTDTEGPYSHTEILEILSEEEWTSDPLAEDLSNVPSDEAVEEADEITEEMFEVLNDEAEESVNENTE